jgi:hypothetical protein
VKKFTIKCVLFILAVSCVFAFNYTINTFFIGLSPPVLNASVLIMGDSHTMTSINDNIIHSSRNISQEAEPYPVTFFKLREIVKHNTIDTLILGCSFQNISHFNDFKFKDKFWSDEIFERIYSITSMGDFSNLEINRESYFCALIKNMILIPKKNHHSYLGRFRNIKKSLASSVQFPDSVIKRHFYYKDTKPSISNQCINYLDSIVSLSKVKNIKLILVNTPLHQEYTRLIPKNIYNSYYNLMRDL